MALTTERIRELWENYSPTQGIESFARSVEAEVRKQEDALILQMLDALESLDGVGAVIAWCDQWEKCSRAITAGRARLGEKT